MGKVHSPRFDSLEFLFFNRLEMLSIASTFWLGDGTVDKANEIATVSNQGARNDGLSARLIDECIRGPYQMRRVVA